MSTPSSCTRMRRALRHRSAWVTPHRDLVLPYSAGLAGATVASSTRSPLSTGKALRPPRPSRPAGPCSTTQRCLAPSTIWERQDRSPLPRSRRSNITSPARPPKAGARRRWGRLSVEFLTCFGAELTPRLDVHHRIRSTRLSDAEVATLRAPPFSPYVDQNVIVRFQSQPPPVPATSRAPLTAKADCAQPASVPAPTLPLPSAQGSAPPSPHAGHLPSLPLPPSPRAAYAPQASMMSTRALLFSSIA